MISASTDKEKARFGLTQKGKPLLIDHEWHHYTKDNTRGEREFWRCTSKATKGCPGRAVTVPTESNKVVFLSQNHITHLISPTQKSYFWKMQLYRGLLRILGCLLDVSLGTWPCKYNPAQKWQPELQPQTY